MYDYNDLVAEYLDLTERIASIVERRDQITGILRTLDQGKHAFSAGTVTVGKPGRRFSADEAAKHLPPELLDACTEQVVTASRAKYVLSPALYELCSTEVGAARVTVKPN